MEEMIFFNSLMKVKTFFGVPFYYLKFVFTVIGLGIYFINYIYMLVIGAILMLIGYMIFPGMEDKNQLKFMFYNLITPKKLTFWISNAFEI